MEMGRMRGKIIYELLKNKIRDQKIEDKDRR
jgi:hypothetical protein